MSKIVDTLRELSVDSDDYVTLSYSEGADVWHINESHVQETVAETSTVEFLAGLLASGVPVYSEWGTPSEGTDLLNEMRGNGALDDYDREGWFEEYLSEVLATTIYDNEYSVEYSTQQYDYKRGRCEISTTVRVRVGDLYDLETNPRPLSFVTPDSLVNGFEVSVETPKGTLALNT
tara:strand:+ start:2849 stop:3376 length:528 start_codon:yes stop_codon:yes gene_type:complete